MALSQPAATTACPALAGRRRGQALENGECRPFFLHGCHALRSDGEAVKANGPAFYAGTLRRSTA